MYLCSNLICLRKRRSLSQAEVAEQFNLGPNTIGSYERGDRQPTLECLIGMAHFFEVTVDDLLTKDLRPQGSMLPQNLKYLRCREHYSQGDMARLLRVSKSNMSKYESGTIEFSNQGLINVSEFFGVSIDDLLKKDLSKGGIEGDNAGEKDCE